MDRDYFKKYHKNLTLEQEIKYRKKDREYQKLKRDFGLIDKTKEYRIWRKKNPKAYKAHQLLNYAIKIGKIKRGGYCYFNSINCSKGKIHAHHEDYDKPLKVMWLCPSHHKKVDLGIGKNLKD